MTINNTNTNTNTNEETIMTKTEYLTFVRNWKAQYKELSEEIRKTKRERAAAAKAGNHDEHNRLNARRQSLRKLAYVMITERHAMKEKAQEAYLAERALRDAA
jgi:hypothetical protein